MDNRFNIYVLNPLLNSINSFSDNNAFYIKGVFYTYKELGKQISKIRYELKKLEDDVNYVGLVVNNDIETYASILAMWLEGKAYVSLNPDQPLERNKEILTQVGIIDILDSCDDSVYSNFKIINTLNLPNQIENSNYNTSIDESNIAYILFTSGSTGEPKGVPITRGNLSGFINAFWDLGIELDEYDRCLQMFELTFDLSVMSYLVPLLRGACVYTIPKDQIKFTYLYELLDDHELTFALMVPSMLNYLRPYFDEMNFPKMKYSLFCGEALPVVIIEEWSQIIPNSKIINVYGPTEYTIFCTSYVFDRNRVNKSYNGVLSVGKEMMGTKIVTIDDKNSILPLNIKGELCLSGIQLTPGYVNNSRKNTESFFYADYDGIKTRFYKTGDICVIDGEDDILYIGRLDSQAQIQGFRVELSEIEFFAKKYLVKKNLAAIAFQNSLGNTEVGLVIEGVEFSENKLLKYLKTKLPSYMIPTKFIFKDSFPLSKSGKIDKIFLKKLLK